MLGALVSIVGITLVISTIVRPMLRYQEIKAEKDFDEFAQMFRLLQASTVREWYPELSRKSLAEIRDNYNVSRAYRDLR